jgi:hypothetical protein
VLSNPKGARRRKPGSRGRKEAKSDQKRNSFRHPKNKYSIVNMGLFESINLADLLGYNTDSVFLINPTQADRGVFPGVGL